MHTISIAERDFNFASSSGFPPPLRISPSHDAPVSSALATSLPPSPTPTQSSTDLQEVEQLVQLIDDDDVEQLEVGTPPETRLEDEPSTILANKILRAHDNPSPPPSPSTPTPCNITQVLARDDLVTTPLPLRSNIRRGADQTTKDLFPSGELVASSSTHIHRNASPNLISFDPNSSLTLNCMMPASTSHNLPQFPSNSVDQLLFASPQEGGCFTSDTSEGQSSSAGDTDRALRAADLIHPHVASVETSLDNDLESNTLYPQHTPTHNDKFVDVSGSHTSHNELKKGLDAMPTPCFTAADVEENDLALRSYVGNSGAQASESYSGGDARSIHTPLSSPIPQARGRSPVRIPQSFHRELNSLSPTSTNLLEQLVSSSSVDADDKSTSLPLFPLTPNSRVLGSSPSPAKIDSSTPQTLVRPRSSPRAMAQTPARRIPIEEAVAQGHVSPQKAAQLRCDLNAVGFGTSRTPVFMIPKVDSPARRVILKESSSGSPSRKQNGLNQLTVEPKNMRNVDQRIGKASETHDTRKFPFPHITSMKDLSSGKEIDRGPSIVSSPAKSTLKQSINPARKLPFPLVAPKKDLSSDKKTAKDSGVASSPGKSNLKQPTCRIPRIGAKPYARPAGMLNPLDKLKVGSSSKSSASSTTAVGSTSSTAMSSVSKAPGHVRVTGEKTNNIIRPGTSATRGHSSDRSAPESLKRKRGPESPPGSKIRPAIIMRRVPNVNVPKAPARKLLSCTTSVATTVKSAPPSTLPRVVKSQRPTVLRIRRVVDRESPGATPRPLSDQAEDVESQIPSSSTAECSSKVGTGLASPPPTVVMENTVASPPLTVPSDLPATLYTEELLTAAQTSGSSPERPVRRTNRVRKPVKPTETANVFKDGSVRQIQRRKAASQAAVQDDAYFGMSANALKALTTSNTNKNQQYVAAKLEREVVRKQGARPESPAVKVRTVLQKQQEEKGKQRKERADRRAKRLESDHANQSEEEHLGDVDSSGYSSPTNRSSELDDGISSETLRRRHRRGAGDEEDYESPDRSESKMRLDEKRVKWDRGLFTTVYLDEVKIGSRQLQKENIQVKGCLAPAVRTLRLDNLGNHPSAGSPVPELVEEHVIVKKFVYEDENENENENENVEEVVVVRNTRSRSKRSSKS